MTGHDDFDRTLARWFEAEAVSPAPADSLERVVVASRRSRPRPGWLAGLGSHWVGEADPLGSSSGVGAIPRAGLRWSTAVLLIFMVALLGGAIMVGARLLQSAPPPAGQLGHLAYGLDGDIYLADWDGRNAIRIADGLPLPDGPHPCGTIWGEGSMWSPDGRYLAYRSDHYGDPCPGTVHVTDAGGRPVASFPGVGWLVSWSPDSTRVATWVERSEQSRTIGIYGLDGVRQALLSLPAGLAPPGDYDPRWSPDGRSLLLRLDPGTFGSTIGVWEIPIDGGTPRRVPANDPQSYFGAAYSRDGARVALVDDGSLVVAAADGGGSRVLASGVEFASRLSSAPLWSPTGDRIAFSWTDAVYDEQANDTLPGTYELRVLDLASGSVTSLVSVYASDPLPLRPITFSPEGDQILFSKADGLWSVNADGSDARLLVSGTIWGDWQWQPAGS